MGNCLDTTKKSTAEIAPSELIKPQPTIKLYGQEESFATSHIRLAIMYKPVNLHFIPSDEHQTPTLVYKSDVVSGSVEDILTYLDSKFPNPPVSTAPAAPPTPAVANAVTAAAAPAVDNAAVVSATSGIWGWSGDSTPLVVWVVKMQHRSLIWHLERLVKWAEDLVARGGRAKGDPSMGTPRMEMKKFGKSYSNLLQLLLEHAQMEETVLFQILESADRGLCKAANEEHAKALPLMNGIKEEIKTVGVMHPGSPDYHDGLSSILSRLKRLTDNCKHHFEEEERDLLPLMEATELTKSQQEKVLQQSLDMMRETHSTMFRYFLEGLQPQDAMRYFDTVKRYCDKVRVSLMLHMMVD